MALSRFAFKAHQASRLFARQGRQLLESLLWFCLSEVLAVNPTKLIVPSRSGSIPAVLGVAQCAKMDVLHPLGLDPLPQPVL
jgi:hypothetical protein